MTNPYKSIIIDDDPLHTRVLRQYLQKCESTTFVDSFPNANSALNYLFSNQIDLVFLDVDLPDMNGWEVLEQINRNTRVIMNSSETYDEEVKKNTHPICDFILKPFSYSRFLTSLEKVNELGCISYFNKVGAIFIRNRGGYLRVLISYISFVESLGDYVRIYTKDGKKYIHHTTLSYFYSTYLLGKNFFQCHRSYIVNVEDMEEINDRQIILNGKTIPISRNRYSLLLKLLNLA